jgi:hypothetical protein
MATKKKVNRERAWEIGAGITAATIAAAAGAYLLSSKKTKAKAKKWVMNVRKEVVKNAKMAKKLGEKEYGHIVDQAIKQYGPLKELTAADIVAAGKELKGEWKKIQSQAKKLVKVHPAKKASSKRKPARKAKSGKKARA